MASDAGSLSIVCSLRWWVLPLIRVLAAIYCKTGWMPDPDRLASFLAKRGARYELSR